MSVEWIWLIFVFAFGSCIGSFLNVVIYRLPIDKSLVTPPSACPACDKRIAFYDNIPLISWLILGGKCRYCKARISPRYFIIELLTGLLFVAVFVLYFIAGIRRFEIDGVAGLSVFMNGGWLFFLTHIILLSGLLAASAIDLELWVIPLSICWFITAAGLVSSAICTKIIDPLAVEHYRLFPAASTTTAALAAGAAIGLIISLIGSATGKIKKSYECQDVDDADTESRKPEFNHRLEVLKEVVFLLPIIIGAIAAFYVNKHSTAFGNWWVDFSQMPVIRGLLGSLWGYFAGCGVVWATRILGTLGFGKEAMGLGDVHLMGAVGAVIGPVFVVIAFFIAPFFGLGWALYRMFFKKTHEIPYGPFLSSGVFAVMILHDWFRNYLANLYF